MRGIRFKPDMIKWIQEEKKHTTFRRTKKDGIYEVVKGSWFKPEPLGIFVLCTPLLPISKETLIKQCYETEGNFKSPKEFIEWLNINKLYKKLPEKGWLNLVQEITV